MEVMKNLNNFTLDLFNPVTEEASRSKSDSSRKTYRRSKMPTDADKSQRLALRDKILLNSIKKNLTKIDKSVL